MLTRAGVVRDPTITSGIGQFAVIQSAATSLGVDISPVDGRNDLESGIAKIARSPNAGLIVTSGVAVFAHRDVIIQLAAQHRLPAVYGHRTWVDHGGLIAYGPDLVVLARLAAGYVDRILNGERPADLPVQAPSRYEFLVNLKTAKALGLTVPPAVLARADEVIE